MKEKITTEELLRLLKEGAQEANENMKRRVDALTPLPKPTVLVALEGAETLSPEEFRGILHNPIYAGVPPFPPITTDEEWIAAAVSLIAEEGPVQFLVNLLAVLRETYRSAFAEEVEEI